MMVKGSGHLTVNETAASKKYRMTLEADKKLAFAPPAVDTNQERVITVPLGDPPRPPKPPAVRPMPPRKRRQPDDHGYFWRLRHSVGLYDRGRAERKERQADLEKQEYDRRLRYYHEDQKRYDEENRAYLVAVEEYKQLQVTVPPPKKPAIEEMSEYDQAVASLRKQIKDINKQRKMQFDLVLEIQADCTTSYNQAKDLMRLPGSEVAATLRATDYVNGLQELNKAQKKYQRLVTDETAIVDTLEEAAEAERAKERNHDMEIVGRRITEDLEEVEEYKTELQNHKMPESVFREAEKANQDLAEVLRGMQEEIKAQTRQDLGMDEPQPGLTQQSWQSQPVAS